MEESISAIKVYDTKPEGFIPQVQATGCYLEVDGKLLLLQRANHKSEPGLWGVPAGKLEENEAAEEGARRELFEETGIEIEGTFRMQPLGALYIIKSDIAYIYHMFKVPMNEAAKVRLSNEHQDYKWASAKDLEEMPLMAGARESLQKYRSPKKRSGTSVNAYLVLRQEGKILFHLRKNTGYCDGMWCLVAGHVEDGEPATAGMIREAREEIGIKLLPSQLRVAHVMHRPSNRMNIDIFFECISWEGAIQNCEPEKCERLEFFSVDDLPTNTIGYIEFVLQAMSRGEFYSEYGWGHGTNEH